MITKKVWWAGSIALIATILGLATALLVARAPSAGAADATDISGTWDLPAGSVAKQSWTFSQGTGTLAGEGGGGPYTWPMEGTISGNAVQIKTAYRETSYTAYFVGTVAADGNTMSGTWSTGGFAAAATSSMTWTANRRQPQTTTTTTTTTPTTATTLHPTGVQVICNRGPNPGDESVCTATVGDGSASELPTAPTGTVAFQALNGGGFPLGNSCALVATPGSPSVSTCSVRYHHPIGSWAFPDIVAEYAGDATHAPASGRTSMIFGPVFGLDGKKVVTKGGPGSAQGCAQGANAATGPLPKAKASANAAVRRDTPNPLTNPTATFGDWVSYCARNALGNVAVAGGSVVKIASVPAGVATTGAAGAIAIVDPEPATKVFFGATAIPAGASVTYLVWNGGQWIVDAGNKELSDPPDPRFTVTVKPRKVPAVRVVTRGRRQRSQTTVLAGYLTTQMRTAALAKALAATVDKAGGARAAGQAAYEGLQMRLAVKYARAMLLEMVALRRQARSAATAIRTLPGVNVKLDARFLRLASMPGKAKVTPKARRALRVIGIGDTEQRVLLASAAVPLTAEQRAIVPKDLAGLVGGRDALRLLDLAIMAQRYYLVDESVVAATKLR